MFYTLSKLGWAFLSPLNLIFVLLALGLVIRLFGGRVGKSLITLSVSLFLICGFFPVGHNLMVYLERQYSFAPELPRKIDGVIVLGGAFDTYLAKQNQVGAINDNADRLVGFLDLVRAYPRATFLFSGGAGHPLAPLHTEAEEIRKFFKTVGLNENRVLYEEKSKNTYENAAFSKALIEPEHGQTWVLVTSAYHMPRAGATFLQQGWHVIPYAVDPRTDGKYRFFSPRFDVSHNFHLLEVAAKEFVGTFVYYITGKSVLPFPQRHDILFGLLDLSKVDADDIAR